MDPIVELNLPAEVSLPLSGSNPVNAGKRSRDALTLTPSAKLSKINAQDDNVSFQPPDENMPNQDTGLDEFGLQIADWEDY